MFEAAGATWGLTDPDFGNDDLPANKTTLQELIEDTGVRTLMYLYDFGDSWEHKLRIGKMTEPAPGELYPRLTDIKGTCPPEDIGGVPGYYYFLEALADNNHPEHDELKEWHGEDFDPESPNADTLRRHVSQLAKRWKPRKR